MNDQNINNNLVIFLKHIDSIRDTLPMTILLIHPYHKKAKDRFTEFLKINTNEVDKIGNTEKEQRAFSIDAEKVKTFEFLEKSASISSLAPKIIHESLFVSLINLLVIDNEERIRIESSIGQHIPLLWCQAAAVF